MANPTPYVPSYDFSDFAAENPTLPLPGVQVDIQFGNISLSLNATIDALAQIRRADGKLANESVGPDQLSSTLSIGFTLRGNWVVATPYSGGDGVIYNGLFYKSRFAHTATALNRPDLDPSTWTFLTSIAAIAIADGSITPVKLAAGSAAGFRTVLALGDLATMNLTDLGDLATKDESELPEMLATAIQAATDKPVPAGADKIGLWDSVSGALRSLSVTNLLAYLAGWFGAPVGQCRLQYVSATAIALYPYNGDKLKIAGKLYAIPQAGVSISNSGLTANTLYNVFAYMAGSTMTLELSLTAKASDTTAGNIGVMIKNADNTRSLVGKVRTNSGNQFANSSIQRFVLNWYNRQVEEGSASSTSATQSTATSPIEIMSALRSEFICWGDEAIEAGANVTTWNTDVGARNSITLGNEGGVSPIVTSFEQARASTATPVSLRTVFAKGTYGEGWHYVTPYMHTASGTFRIANDYDAGKSYNVFAR